MKTLILTVMLSSFNLYSPQKEIKIATLKTEISKEQIFEQVDKLPFKYPDLIKQQILLESSHLKSDIALNNNNICGMRQAKSRITTAIGSRKGYAVFSDVSSCLLDRLLYEATYLEDKNREEYLQFLNETYSSGDGKYCEVLLGIKIAQKR